MFLIIYDEASSRFLCVIVLMSPRFCNNSYNNKGVYAVDVWRLPFCRREVKCLEFGKEAKMASNLFSIGSRRLLPTVRCFLRPQLRMKSESAKEAFQKIFPGLGAAKLKPRYDANSYGQTLGPEYPFDIEKTPEGKIKREKSKGAIGSVTVEEIVDILRSNGGENIKVAKLHQDLHYADNFVVVSGKDTEHLKRMTQDLATKVCLGLQQFDTKQL